MSLHIQLGLQERHRAAAAALYWQAFGGKLGAVMGPDTRARAYVMRVIDPAQCIAATKGDDLVGIVGLNSQAGGFAGGTAQDFVAVYGAARAALRLPALIWVAGPQQKAGTLMIDGFSVRPDLRGAGIGAALLAAALSHARAGGYGHVHLDVINTNWRARAFYQRHGFSVLGQRSIWPLRIVFGFDSVQRLGLDLA